jgi:DNA-binding transcriptional ArsR family regulator
MRDQPRDKPLTRRSHPPGPAILKSSLDNSRDRRIVKSVLNQSAVAGVFHALGDPTRRAIIERLSHGSLSVSDLAKPLEVTLAAVVQHLQVLEDSGIVRTEKVGRVRSCHLEPSGLRVAQRWIAERQSLWESYFDRLGQLLDEPAPEAKSSGKKVRT